jgi:hypothetical protein
MSKGQRNRRSPNLKEFVFSVLFALVVFGILLYFVGHLIQGAWS